MAMYSIIFLALATTCIAASLPCPISCSSCSSSTQCTTCASQYFPNSTSGTLQCQPCGPYCLTCNSATTCTVCISPYVLQADGSCAECQIANAAKCSSIVAASQCTAGYYTSDNYCYSCLLNCVDCTSNTDCRACASGYYLNSSVLTCNLCPSNCLTCDQYNSSRCLSCQDGYSLSAGYTCDSVSCTIANCLHCLTSTVCKQCTSGYYWSAAQNACLVGASVMCDYGAEGPYPNQCNQKCSAYAYVGLQSGTALWCLPYNNIGINGSNYYQIYLYAYTNMATLSQLLSTSKSLTAQPTGEYSYTIDAGNILTIASLPSYFKITLSIKYRSQQSIQLSLSATTQAAIQSENATLQAQPTVATSVTVSSVYLHSNNLQIKFNGSLYLVQLLVRTKNCPANCYRCLNKDLCEMCQAPQYVSSYKCVDNCTIYYHLTTNRTCLTACPDLFYPANLGTNQKYCYPCQPPCLRCLAADKCLACVTGKYLFNYTCISVCPDTYYAGVASGVCQPCISPCRLCFNQTSCISCRQGYWDTVSSACTIQCPSGYYGNDTNQQCAPCQSPCLTCRNSSTRCVTCVSGRYYQDYQCLAACPQRYYPNTTNFTCLACRPPCLTCTSITACLSCSYDYLHNGQCIQACPVGYYENLANKSCDACSPQCRTCQMLGECTSCKTSTCFFEGACLSACPVGKYYTSLANPGTINQQCSCLQCQYPCKQCLSALQCSSCLQGYLLASTHQCLNSCPSGFYANNITFECAGCDTKYGANCLQCNVSSCTRCGSSYLLHNGMCLSACPAQHYKSSQTCQKCVAPCLECSSFTQCITCTTPYLFSNGSCIIQCPFGKVASLNITSNNSICIPCQAPCITCQNGSPTNCTMCAYGYFLFASNNTCVTQCSAMAPANTYYNELVTSTCSMCMFPCQTCVSQTVCLSCQIGFLTSAGKCENCPFGSYANVSQGVCINCPSQCSNCYSGNYCTGCHQGYYLYAHQCVSNTSICLVNGYYPIGRVCEPCQMPCLQCNLTSTNCLSCVTGYIFFPPNLCITQCPKGSFRNGTQCSPCHPFCQSCSGTDSYCFGCKSPYLMVSSQMSCTSGCPNGTFVVGTTCQLCQYPCLECTSQTQCTSCVSGTLVGTTCLSSCPSGYYSDSMTCHLCQAPCSECQTSATTCRQCVTGHYLLNNQCLPSCPALFFGQIQAHQCLQCLGLCGECSSHVNCTSCNPGFAFFNNTVKNYGQCLSDCPTSYYNTSVQVSGLTRDQCVACLPQCLSCSNNTSCILCKNNTPQYQGQCVTQCPAQMYSHNGICQNCSAPCFNCTDAFTCTACMNNSFLLVGSAECIVGEVCPLGFYRIPNTRNCNGRCPSGYYHRNDRTCSSAGCDVEEYKGADMFCYSKCPEGYKSDAQYKCQVCSGQDCNNGLFYDITPAIIRDQLYLYLIFREDPQYLVSEPKIKLTPYFQSKIEKFQTQRLLQQGRLLATGTINQIRNITLQLFPESSFSEQSLTLTFESALASFKNPIQRTSKTVILPGFDIYPQTMSLSIGFLLLGCALVGMVKNPYMTDFAQLIYLLALVNLHYPNNLYTALQSSNLAHLHGIVQVEQMHAVGRAKFSYLTDMGLLSNCTANLLVIAIGLVLFLILFVVYQIVRRAVSYNKVDQDPQECVGGTIGSEINEAIKKSNELGEENTSVRVFRCLQANFIQDFKMNYLNRLLYFNYLPLAVFTFAQLSSLSFTMDSLTDVIGSILSFPVLLGLLAYPWLLYSGNKPKYTFLMLRKLVLGLIVVISVENPTYMIGVTAVVSIMTGILVGAYGMEKWQVQTKFNAAMQICQAVLLVFFAIFAMIGEGNNTNVRLYLSWIIILLVILICLAYIVFSIFCLILWGCKKFKDIDYVELWKQKESEKEIQNDSETNSDHLKDKETSADPNHKTVKFEKLFVSLQKQFQKQDNLKQRTKAEKDHNKENAPASPNNNLFWTYNDNDDEKQNEQKAPKMLVRCVNQFSDYDPKEKRQD